MKLKWTNQEIRNFAKPVKTAEKNNEYAWWGMFGVAIIMGVIFILKILGKI